MFLHTLRICSDEHFAEEMPHIYSLGEKLKYPKTFIYRKSRNTSQKNSF